MIRGWKDLQGHLEERCDVVVVGSGAGGAVAAFEAAAAGLDVVLLEEGGHHDPGSFDRDPMSTLAKLYRNAGTTCTLGRPWIPLPLGCCVGGTTVINSGTCFRIPDATLQRWRRDHGLDAIRPEELHEAYARVEDRLGVAPVLPEVRGRNAETFLRGADALGWSHAPLLRNAPDCRGCGVCAHGCPSGAKRSTLVSYIPEAMAHGARVYADCRVERVLVKGGRAVGVRGQVREPRGRNGQGPSRSGRGQGNARLEVRAKAVVVACGAIHTPVLLSASGLAGPSGRLGRGLHLHPGARVVARMREEVEGWKGVPQGTMVDEFADQGILMEGIFVVPGLMAPAFESIGARVRGIMADYRRLAAYGAMVDDSSEGSVSRIPGTLEPVIRYSLNDEDCRRLHRAAALLAEAFFAAGAVEVFPGHREVDALRSIEEVRAFARHPARPEDLEPVAFHPQATCRMGKDPARSVIDPEGRHHQVPNLYVADGSVFPTSLGVNPMLTIMALATRSAQRMADRMLSSFARA